MSSEILLFLDNLFFEETGKHLDTLQQKIIKGILNRQKYCDIADEYKCSLFRVKETASEMLKVFSEIFGEKTSKSNLEAIIERRFINSFDKSVQINGDLLGASIYSIICFGSNLPSSSKQRSPSSNIDPHVAGIQLCIDRMRQEGLSDEQITRILGLKVSNLTDN